MVKQKPTAMEIESITARLRRVAQRGAVINILRSPPNLSTWNSREARDHRVLVLPRLQGEIDKRIERKSEVKRMIRCKRNGFIDHDQILRLQSLL